VPHLTQRHPCSVFPDYYAGVHAVRVCVLCLLRQSGTSALV
jgi:hypothetical protein